MKSVRTLQRPWQCLSQRPSRSGMTLIEISVLLFFTGAMMLVTMRAFNMATQVHETGVKVATHLQLVQSLEDRLRSDVARAREVQSASPNEVRLLMADASEVVYLLSQPNVVERHVTVSNVDQRWKFTCTFDLHVTIKPLDQRQLVRIAFRHPDNASSTQSTWRMLRSIEVSEVTHAR